MRKIETYRVNLLEKAKKFGVEIILASSDLPKNPAGFALASQLVRAATSIGANLTEAQEANSNREFLYKIGYSLKEAKETKYWLELISLAVLLPSARISPLLQENEEIVKILVITLKRLRSKKV